MSEKIEIGEYIRTTDGNINRVINIIEAGQGCRTCGERLQDTIYILDKSHTRIDEYDIAKHSKNIIDLIEVRRHN